MARFNADDLLTLAGVAAPFTGPAAPFIEAGLAGAGILRSGMKRRKAQEGMQGQLAQEAADRARIEQQATSDAPSASDQQAIAMQAGRSANETAMAQSNVGRMNLQGTPAGQAMMTQSQDRLAQSSDQLTAHLADLRDQRRQRAIYQLPALSARRSSLMASIEDPSIAQNEALATGAAQEFGRTISPEGSAIGGWMNRRKQESAHRQGYAKMNPTVTGFNPSANSPVTGFNSSNRPNFNVSLAQQRGNK